MTVQSNDRPTQHTSYKSSQFELEMAGVTEGMYPGKGMADENDYVMSYEDAYKLVSERYLSYLQVNERVKLQIGKPQNIYTI